MSPREQITDFATSPVTDVQENVRQFNDDAAVWTSSATKRARRKRLQRLLHSFGWPSPLTEAQLDQLDWCAAEGEAAPARAIGKWLAP